MIGSTASEKRHTSTIDPNSDRSFGIDSIHESTMSLRNPTSSRHFRSLISSPGIVSKRPTCVSSTSSKISSYNRFPWRPSGFIPSIKKRRGKFLVRRFPLRRRCETSDRMSSTSRGSRQRHGLRISERSQEYDTWVKGGIW